MSLPATDERVGTKRIIEGKVMRLMQVIQTAPPPLPTETNGRTECREGNVVCARWKVKANSRSLMAGRAIAIMVPLMSSIFRRKDFFVPDCKLVFADLAVEQELPRGHRWKQ
jgi:hypothetical protein